MKRLLAGLLLALPALAAAGPDGTTIAGRVDRLVREGRYAEAIPLAEAALDALDEAAPPPARAAAQHRLADLYRRMGRHEEAEELARAALEIRTGQAGPRSDGAASSLLLLGKVLAGRGRLGEADGRLAEALAIREELHGPDHAGVADCLHEIALLRYGQGRYDDAEAPARRGLAIRREALGPRHWKIGESLNGLGLILLEQARLDEADEALRRSLAIKREALGPDHPHVGATLNNLAVSLTKLGRPGEAAPLFREALRIDSSVYGPDHPHVGTGASNLAAVLTRLGRFVEAEDLLRRAVEIAERGEPESPALGFALTNLARNRIRTGRLREGADLYAGALAAWERALGPDHPRLVVGLNNLASARIRLEEEAGPLLERALRTGEAALGANHPLLGFTWHHRARLAAQRGDLEEALRGARRALDIWEEALGPGHLRGAVGASYLGSLLEASGDLPGAAEQYSRALEIQERLLGPGHPDTGSTLCRLGLVLDARGEPGAHALLARGTAILERSRQELLSLLTEGQQLSYLRLQEPELHGFLAATARRGGEDPAAVTAAFERWLGWKGTGLEVWARGREAARRDRDTMRILDGLRDARRELAGHWLRRPRPGEAEEYRARAGRLASRVEELERGLGAGAGPPRGGTARELAARLPDDAAYLDFALVRPHLPGPAEPQARYLLFVLTPGEAPALHDLGEAGPIDAAVGDYLTRIEQGLPPAGLRRYSRALHRLLLGRVAGRLEGRRQLLISADGGLELLPFEVLQSAHGSYLLERFEIAYLPSGRDLLRDDPRAGGTAWVLADPDYDAGVEVAVAGGGPGPAPRALEGGFPRLPGARAEGRAVAGILEGMGLPVELRTGVGAGEEALWSIRRPRVLHLATHGFFLDDAGPAGGPGLRSAIDALREGLPEIEDDPLQRSGVALAGANVSLRAGGDGGVVTAGKLLGLDLQGTDLVVLSACDTALGEVRRGEGVFGLERAFLLAGARTLVLGLWPVSDEATRELMVDFYTRWAGGASKAAALRGARLAALRRSGHPADWGAFILVGDPG